ncbi:hypothetical protein HC864_01010 [Candidatus Gracilibacteria bacterium]|nr:hypothetical protein [Candidatus Gracilibacteria bacterium]
MKGVIGLGNFLPDFEKGISGMKQGEIKTFMVKFPNNYFESSLAGKSAEFTVGLVSVAKPKYNSIVEVLNDVDHNGHDHTHFDDEKSFDEYVQQYYGKETEKMIEDQWQKNALQEVIVKSGKIPLVGDRVTQETDRIFGLIREDSDKQKEILKRFLQ